MSQEFSRVETEPFLPVHDESPSSKRRRKLLPSRWITALLGLSRLYAGAIFAIFVLYAHSYFLETRPSPRAIATSGWRKAQEVINQPKDGFKNYYREETCNISSLDIYKPSKPICKGRKKFLEAMSSGGRTGWDQPYQSLGCDMKWLSTPEICDVLSRFDNIYLFGDSLMRHTQDALHVILRADLVNGARATWRTDTADEPRNCTCRNIFDYSDCFWWGVPSTEFVLDSDPLSIPCRSDQRPALIKYFAVPDFPIIDIGKDTIKNSFEKIPQPTGRDVFVFGQGLWNRLEPERTMSWMEELEKILEDRNPSLFTPEIDFFHFPRLYISPTNQGANKPDEYITYQNNLRVQLFTEEIKEYMGYRGIDFLGMFNVTAQNTSPDGTHAGMEVNLLKAMIILNWMSMLDPEPISTPKQPIPSEPTDIWNKNHPSATTALPSTFINDVAPVLPASSDSTSKSDSTITSTASPTVSPGIAQSSTNTTDHPIHSIVAKARSDHERLVDKSSKTLQDAADKYERRRGRLPPPNFDKWYDYARKHQALVVEEFFDPLYESLDLLWTVSVDDVRLFPSMWQTVISIRNGTSIRRKIEKSVFNNPMDVWQAALDQLPLTDLPDIDLAFNPTDEPRLFVSSEYRTKARTILQNYEKPHGNSLVSTFAKLDPFQADDKEFPFLDLPDDSSIWPLAQKACAPDTTGASADDPTSFSTPALDKFPSRESLSFMSDGFITSSGYSSSKSACLNPALRLLHGTFISPQRETYILRNEEDRWALMDKPVPLLGSCRIHDITAEIPIPGSVYFEASEKEGASSFFRPAESALRFPWDEKLDKVFWRGAASGGINNADNWTRFQRHRLVSMLNASQVSETLIEIDQGQKIPDNVPGGDPALPFNFPVEPDTLSQNDTNSQITVASAAGNKNRAKSMANWIKSIADVAFTHLRCFPPASYGFGDGTPCEYSGPFYSPLPVSPFDEAFKSKYLLDIDGASWSGRFWALLMSDSTPIKATIFDEWHDGRLTAWKHFIPFDTTAIDLWSILDFFLSFKDPTSTVKRDFEGSDTIGKTIAGDGATWSRKVLRQEDMNVYMYRLILELARVSDKRRDSMGWRAEIRKFSNGPEM